MRATLRPAAELTSWRLGIPKGDVSRAAAWRRRRARAAPRGPWKYKLTSLQARRARAPKPGGVRGRAHGMSCERARLNGRVDCLFLLGRRRLSVLTRRNRDTRSPRASCNAAAVAHFGLRSATLSRPAGHGVCMRFDSERGRQSWRAFCSLPNPPYCYGEQGAQGAEFPNVASLRSDSSPLVSPAAERRDNCESDGT